MIKIFSFSLSILIFYGISDVFAQGKHIDQYQQNDSIPVLDMLTIAQPTQNITFNFVKSISVFESTLYSALYNGLVIADPKTLQPRVGLAVSWFVSEDKKTYTFNLRKHARFSDGSYVTASDVRASWLASIREKTPFTYLFYSIKGVTDYMEGSGKLEDIGITIVSDRTLQVALSHPINYFLKIISHSAFSVSSRFQMASRDWDAEPDKIAYSGAYVVEEALDNKITLVKNPYYWGKENVQIENIVIHLYDENNAKEMFDAFQKGEIQWLNPNSTISTDHIADVDKDMIQKFSVFGTTYLFFKTSDEVWKNTDIRRAIRLLLPLEDMLPTLYSFPAKSLVPEIRGVYSSPRKSIQKHDKETAYQLLKGAGYPKGVGLPPLIILAPSSETGEYAEIFTEMETKLEKALELEVIVKPVSFDNYYDALQSEKYVIGSNNWIGDFADPMAFLQMWMYENTSLGHYYNDKKFRNIITQSFALSADERETTLQKAEEKLLESSIVIPLHHLYALELVRTDLLNGWSMNPLNILNLAALSFVSEQDIPYIIYNQKYYSKKHMILVQKY